MPDPLKLPTPALILDLDRLEANLEAMAARCRRLGVALRPHVKTHKCLEIARLQQSLGASGLTVSTLEEAEALAAGGFDDLTWALPLPLSCLEPALALARRIRLRLLVDSDRAIDALEDTGEALHVWLKVDCGYHRAGVDPAAPEAFDLVRRLDRSPSLLFDGLLSHSGHAYHVSGRQALARVAEEERAVMANFAETLRHEGIGVPGVSVGSTPAMSAVEGLSGITEARPGNYAFYDYTQVVLGACDPGDCAVSVLATVISSPPGAAHAVVDAGALALSKDTGPPTSDHPSGSDGGLGRVWQDPKAAKLHPDHRLTALSQEHGILNTRLEVGEKILILPNHSCLTVACFDEYQVVRGDEVVDRWKIWRGR